MSQKKTFLLFVFLIIFQTSFVALGEDPPPLVWDLPTQGITSLMVSGLKAKVRFSYKPNSALRIQVNGEAQLTKELTSFVLKLKEPANKIEWGQLMSEKAESAFPLVEISGPYLPLEIHLREGTVTGKSWKKPIRISLIDGQVVMNDMESDLNLFIYKGTAKIEKCRGGLQLSGYSVNAEILKHIGDQNYNIFKGELKAEELSGVIDIHTVSGIVKILNSSGTVQLDSNKGTIHFQKFSGKIEGQTSEGSIHLSVTENSEINLKSKLGAVSVILPSQSGAYLNLLTEGGELMVPPEVKVWRSSVQKVATGRVKGETQQGRIWVRSKEGNITIR